MKTITHYLCFGLILSGAIYSFAEASSDSKFQSLKTRSPFGDAAPKPVAKAVAPKTQTKPVEPPAPRKPELNLMLTGVVDIDGKKYFSVAQKDPKETFYEVITLGQKSSQGKTAKSFDEQKNALTVEVNGYDYVCVLGDDGKKNSNASGSSNVKYRSGSTSSGLPSNPVDGNRSNTYDPYKDYNFNFDDWDDWDDDDWDDWDF